MHVRKRLGAICLGLSLAATGGCGDTINRIIQGIQSKVGDVVSGELAAALAGDAGQEVLRSLGEGTTQVNLTVTGDGKFIIVPVKEHPPFEREAPSRGGAGGTTSETTATTDSGGPALAPPGFPLGSTETDAEVRDTETGYVRATTDGPDGAGGWYVREGNGYAYWYKTVPAADLSRGWPEDVDVLYTGWTAEDADTGRQGYTWWMRHEVLSATHVRGEWHFEVGPGAARYAGTAYDGSYDYDVAAGEYAVVAIEGAMRQVDGNTTREAYTDYAYAFTAATDSQSGVYYFGRGPAESYSSRPPWTEGVNPAGPDWTDAGGRDGLYQYQVWTDNVVSWWRYDGTSRDCSTRADNIDIRADDTRVTVGRTIELVATVRNNCGDRLRNRTVSWASSDESVATVNQDGIVTGIEAGQATITAAADGVDAGQGITVRELDVTPAKVVVDGMHTVEVGSTVDLDATVYNQYDEALPDAAVEWTSTDAGVAGVDADGQVRGEAVGEATIRAASGDVVNNHSMEVYDPNAVVSVYMSCAENKAVGGGDAFDCNATAYNFLGQALGGTVFTWTSSDDTVATVDSTGTVHPLDRGTTTIRAKAGDASATLSLQVFSPDDVAYVVVQSTGGVTLRAHDGNYTLVVEATAYNFADEEIPGIDFVWTSNDTEIATVDALDPADRAEVGPGGDEGTTTVRATDNNTGAFGSIFLESLDNRIDRIEIDNQSGTASLAFGGQAQLRAEAYNVNNRFIGYVQADWSSESPGLVAVDDDGLVTANGDTTAEDVEIMAAIDLGTGPGQGTDTLDFDVYDPDAVVSLAGFTCWGHYDVFAGNVRSCSVQARNLNGDNIAGAPVQWHSAAPGLVEVINVDNTSTPQTADFRVPATVDVGAEVAIYALANCDPEPPETPATPADCDLQAGPGTIDAKGFDDVQYVDVEVLSGMTSGGVVQAEVGNAVVLGATAYDWQVPAQEIEDVSFVWTVDNDGTDNFVAGAAGTFTAQTRGTDTLRATVVGGGASGTIGAEAFDPGYIDDIDIRIVNALGGNPDYTNRELFEDFYVEVFAEQDDDFYGSGDTVPTADFQFSSQNGRISLTPISGHQARAEFTACDCTGSSGSDRVIVSPDGGTTNYYDSYFNVDNPVTSGTIELGFTPGTNRRVTEGTQFAFSADAESARPVDLVQVGSWTPTVLQVYPNGPTAGNSLPATADVLAYPMHAGYTSHNQTVVIEGYAEETSTGAGRTFYSNSLYFDPPTVDTGAMACSGSGLSLFNGTLKQTYHYLSAAEYGRAATYATLATVGTADRDVLGVSSIGIPLTMYGSGGYGLRNFATGEVTTANFAAETTGRIQFDGLSSDLAGRPYLYVRFNHWEAGRLWLGGLSVYDRWELAGTDTAVGRFNGGNDDFEYRKLVDVPELGWCALRAEGLFQNRPGTAYHEVFGVDWSATGSTYYDDPGSVPGGWILSREP